MFVHNNYLERYVAYYVEQLDPEIGELIRQDHVHSEHEAIKLINFIDILCEQSSLDMEEQKVVLGEIADIGDAEKVSLILLKIVKDSGYSHLVDEWLQ